jgi:hypothetical protein
MMENENAKVRAQKIPESVPAEHAIVPVPFTVMQAITNYLTQQPWNDVNQFLQILGQLQAIDKRKIPMEE